MTWEDLDWSLNAQVLISEPQSPSVKRGDTLILAVLWLMTSRKSSVLFCSLTCTDSGGGLYRLSNS